VSHPCWQEGIFLVYGEERQKEDVTGARTRKKEEAQVQPLSRMSDLALAPAYLSPRDVALAIGQPRGPKNQKSDGMAELLNLGRGWTLLQDWVEGARLYQAIL